MLELFKAPAKSHSPVLPFKYSVSLLFAAAAVLNSCFWLFLTHPFFPLNPPKSFSYWDSSKTNQIKSAWWVRSSWKPPRWSDNGKSLGTGLWKSSNPVCLLWWLPGCSFSPWVFQGYWGTREGGDGKRASKNVTKLALLTEVQTFFRINTPWLLQAFGSFQSSEKSWPFCQFSIDFTK